MKEIELDSIDRALLRELQSNGRATQKALAGKVGLSLPALGERLRKLEARGIIQGYPALVSPEALGLGLLAFIRLSIDHPQYASAEASFLKAVATEPEILECHHVAGEDAYVLKARTRDTSWLSALLGRLKALPGVSRTNTSIVLDTAKCTTVLPVPG